MSAHNTQRDRILNENCAIKECRNKARARGWCRMHYLRFWKYGDPEKSFYIRRKATAFEVAESFWKQVEVTPTCWNWKGYIAGNGYGRFRKPGAGSQTTIPAHRFSYEEQKGKVPKGLQLDHLCRNRCCVKPDHLEAVTGLVNVRRGETATKPACVNGHAFTPENTRIANNGWRRCRACARDRWRKKNWSAKKYRLFTRGQLDLFA